MTISSSGARGIFTNDRVSRGSPYFRIRKDSIGFDTIPQSIYHPSFIITDVFAPVPPIPERIFRPPKNTHADVCMYVEDAYVRHIYKPLCNARTCTVHKKGIFFPPTDPPAHVLSSCETCPSQSQFFYPQIYTTDVLN